MGTTAMKHRNPAWLAGIVFASYIIVLASAAQAAPGHHKHADPACAVALAPHPGNSKWVRKVNVLQGQALRLSNDADVLEQLAWVYLERARVRQQPSDLALLQTAADCLHASQPTAARFFSAYVLYSQHQFHAAEELVREVAGERGLPADFALLGDALLEQGRLDEAAEVYQRLMNLKPGPGAYLRAAWIRQQRGQLDGAVEFARLAARAVGAPTTPAAAWFHMQFANILFERGDLDSSSQVLAGVLRMDTDNPDARLLHGKLALARTDVPSAVESLVRAVDAAPMPIMQWALIEAYRLAGNFDAAAVEERNLLAYGNRLDPRTTALYLAHTGQDLRRARRMLEHEIQDRRDVATVDGLAWVLHQAGEHRQAWALIEQALEWGTLNPRVHLHAALIARAMGDEAAFRLHADVSRSFAQSLFPSERRMLERVSTDFAALIGARRNRAG
ncbi:MAG: tetratricopeptide repeat protein [Gammaproteobacteria bacterium]|nr:tetratricopeptide repeat protein [Gammaproteobacteria bacterium]